MGRTLCCYSSGPPFLSQNQTTTDERSMKHLSALVASSLLCCAALSATPAKERPASKTPSSRPVAPQVQAPITPAPPPAPIATGPMGLLALKVGMTKEAVEALAAADEVYLSEPLVEDTKLTRPGKRTWYKGKLKSPLANEPVVTTMVFDQDGLMTFFSLELSEATLEGVEKQLVAKYGAAKVDDKSDEEQCIYKNGSNFKLPNKERTATWKTPFKDGADVETSINVMVKSFCPSNLRYGGIGPIKLASLSFSRKDPKPQPEPPKKELF